MEVLEKGLKELKCFVTPKEEQQYQPTRTPHPRVSKDKTTNQRIHTERPMTPAAYVAQDGLVGYQQEERMLVLWRLDVPV